MPVLPGDGEETNGDETDASKQDKSKKNKKNDSAFIELSSTFETDMEDGGGEKPI